MAEVSLEEVSHAFQSNNVEKLRSLYVSLSNEIKSESLIKEGDHFRLLSENYKSLSRCFQVEWCIPQEFVGDLIPLR